VAALACHGVARLLKVTPAACPDSLVILHIRPAGKGSWAVDLGDDVFLKAYASVFSMQLRRIQCFVFT
jgi:hypothetical protein